MSKESFKEHIVESLQDKFNVLGNGNPSAILECNEYYELALCLAYLTLSKEHIIHKDMDNHNRMDRLTNKTDTKEIDKVFAESFAEQMPVITKSLESDNSWILDNIRDSIMHGMFDVDEERKVFIINNSYYDRDFEAEIPFSWIIAYAKNDILTKRCADKYNVSGCFYNKYRSYKRLYNTEKELKNNIFYNAYITGNNFNVHDIEKRIRELFEVYSREDIDQNKLIFYLEDIHKDGFTKYEGYYLPFYITRDRVKETIEKEYPGVNVDIKVNRRKGRFINKELKRLPKLFTNYETMIDIFNEECCRKGISTLEYISTIISNLHEPTEYKYITTYDELRDFIKLFSISGRQYNNANDIRIIYQNEAKILESIILNVLGLATIVINYDSLTNEEFLNSNPSVFGMSAISKSPYMEYAIKAKSNYKEILDLEIKLFEKEKQYENGPEDQKNNRLQEIIKIKNDINVLYHEIQLLASTLNIIPEYRDYEDNGKLIKINSLVDTYYGHFSKAKKKNDKYKIKKIISGLLEKRMEEESKTMFSRCNTMKETIEIIRNGFAHVGRVRITDKRIVIINDYDNDNNKTGEVICPYQQLLEILLITNSTEKRDK